MVERDEAANAASRFGWFSVGALSVLVALALLLYASNLFGPSDIETGTPPVIIEAP